LKHNGRLLSLLIIGLCLLKWVKDICRSRFKIIHCIRSLTNEAEIVKTKIVLGIIISNTYITKTKLND